MFLLKRLVGLNLYPNGKNKKDILFEERGHGVKLNYKIK